MKLRLFYSMGLVAMVLPVGTASAFADETEIVWTESTDTPPWTLEEGSQLVYDRYDGSDGSTKVVVTSGSHYIPADQGGGDVCGGKVGVTVTETNVIINGGEKIKRIIGGNENYGYIEGDRNIVVNGGSADYIYGGDWYIKPDHGGLTSGYTSAETYGVQSSTGVWVPKKSSGDINITINGGSIGQIRGGHNCEDYVSIDPRVSENVGYYVDENGQVTSARPYAVSGNVNIVLAGGTVGGKESDAIRGAGGSWCSVDGNVNITVKNEALVKGNIYAGARNKYGEVGGTGIRIEGGEVQGNVYGGGSYSSYQTLTKGDTRIVLSGGKVTGNIYAAGNNDIVNGSTYVTVLGTGTELGENSIVSGGGVGENQKVNGTRNLQIGEVDIKSTCSLTIQDFDALTIAAGSEANLAAGTAFNLDNVTVLLNAESAFNQVTLNLTDITVDKWVLAVMLSEEQIAAGSEIMLDNITISGTGLDFAAASPMLVFVDEQGKQIAVNNAALSGSNGVFSVAGTIPEPTTATLSLIALAALVTRRRRK